MLWSVPMNSGDYTEVSSELPRVAWLSWGCQRLGQLWEGSVCPAAELCCPSFTWWQVVQGSVMVLESLLLELLPASGATVANGSFQPSVVFSWMFHWLIWGIRSYFILKQTYLGVKADYLIAQYHRQGFDSEASSDLQRKWWHHHLFLQ